MKTNIENIIKNRTETSYKIAALMEEITRYEIKLRILKEKATQLQEEYKEYNIAIEKALLIEME